MLGLRCCEGAFSSCGQRGLLSSWSGLAPTTEGSLGLQGSEAQWCTGLATLQPVGWSEPGIEPESPALAGGFPAAGPPGKLWNNVFLDRGTDGSSDYSDLCTWQTFS